MEKSDIFNKKKGFTLIEMVVSIAVFLLISGVSVGIFLSIIQRQKEVLSEQELLNQISYVEEYMSRALRMAKAATSNSDISCLGQGNIYVLTRPENGFYNGIKFLNQTDGVYDGSERNAMCEEIFLDTDAEHPVLVIKKGQNLDAALPIALTSPDVKINYIRFGVNGLTGSLTDCSPINSVCAAATNSDEIQPRVTILLGVGGSRSSCTTGSDCQIAGEGCDDGECRPIRTIQTTVSQRNLNVSAQP